MLDVVGNLFGCILQDRLKKLLRSSLNLIVASAKVGDVWSG